MSLAAQLLAAYGLIAAFILVVGAVFAVVGETPAHRRTAARVATLAAVWPVFLVAGLMLLWQTADWGRR